MISSIESIISHQCRNTSFACATGQIGVDPGYLFVRGGLEKLEIHPLARCSNELIEIDHNELTKMCLSELIWIILVNYC